MESLKNTIQSSIETKQKIAADQDLLNRISKSIEVSISAFRDGKKVLFCGNGGSAADAQHLAAEFTGRFYYDRPPLFSEALHTNTSYLTAVANDYSYDDIYSRQVMAKAQAGDILIGLSTSGNSGNIVKAFEQAKKQGVITIAYTGETGGKLKDLADILINVPSDDTPRIQEAHILIGHMLCEEVEKAIFPKE